MYWKCLRPFIWDNDEKKIVIDLHETKMYPEDEFNKNFEFEHFKMFIHTGNIWYKKYLREDYLPLNIYVPE